MTVFASIHKPCRNPDCFRSVDMLSGGATGGFCSECWRNLSSGDLERIHQAELAASKDQPSTGSGGLQ